jgi:hypothetical protein
MTISDERALRHCVLRFFWDGEETPSVEVPLGDFFAVGHGISYPINSLPVVVNPKRGLNCYWPMPFRKNCRITIEHQGWYDIQFFLYQITYILSDVQDEAGYFHASWRRTKATDLSHPEHVILDNVRGRGHYIGTFLAWARRCSNSAWTEGEIKFYIDEDHEDPSICSTGTEDYCGGAWGFTEKYSTPFLGHPYIGQEPGGIPKHAMYRWHILDPVRFEERLRVTVQTLGWVAEPGKEGIFVPLSDDVASVAYWYQIEPHVEFPQFPRLEDREPL